MTSKDWILKVTRLKTLSVLRCRTRLQPLNAQQCSVVLSNIQQCSAKLINAQQKAEQRLHTVNSGSEMVEAKHVSGKNIFWSTLTAKSRGGKIFEFLHCPFEGRANMHHKIQPNWLTGRCCLAGGSKGQCRKSKIFLSLLLPIQVDLYIFFPETCFAPTISEPEFTV